MAERHCNSKALTFREATDHNTTARSLNLNIRPDVRHVMPNQCNFLLTTNIKFVQFSICTCQDALVFTLQNMCSEVLLRSPQQVVSVIRLQFALVVVYQALWIDCTLYPPKMRICKSRLQKVQCRLNMWICCCKCQSKNVQYLQILCLHVKLDICN